MRDGKCRSCGSLSVFARQNGIKIGDAYNGVFVYTSVVTLPAQTVAFVCVGCGYFEHHITDQRKLAEVARTWDRVEPPVEAI